ncbi:MAG: FkbM family methyltransferase [Coleofasciculus sp. S288]|nr:FkbM family methyltransferase [Coleofasciculus sp. S288]
MKKIAPKKVLRSILFNFSSIYDFVSKNRYWLNYYLKIVHEKDFEAFKLITDNSPQLFLDVGANVGMSALSILIVKPNAKIISFEANPINYPHLDKIANQFSSFEYKKFGLADENKSLIFYCPVYNNKTMTTLASFDYEEAKNWLNSDTVYGFDSNKLKIESIPLEVRTLDSFELNPDFIKIDVQGFEYQVLLGAKETISRCKPIFLIESVKPDDDVHKLLKSWGYSVYKFKSGKFFLNQFNSLNQFFFPQEKLYLIQNFKS